MKSLGQAAQRERYRQYRGIRKAWLIELYKKLIGGTP